MNLNVFYNVQVAIEAAAQALPSFDAEAFFVDDEQIPADQRYRIVTKDDFDELTAASIPRLAATAYFAQALKGDAFVLCRYISADVSPAYVCGASYETDYTVYAAISDGSFCVTDSDLNEVDVTAIDFTGDTSMTLVLATLNAKLAALVAPAVVGLDTAEFEIDALNRLVLKMPTGQDSTDPTFTLSATDPVSGTDISTLFDVANGTALPGYDAETLLEAHDACKVLTNYYNIAIADRSGNDAEIVALVAQIQSERCQMTVVTNSAAAYASGSSADLASLIYAQSYGKVLCIYTSKSDFPDCAGDGRFLPEEEGTARYGHRPLVGCENSGTVGTYDDITSTQRSVLTTKHYNYIAQVGGSKICCHGLNVDGQEKRMVLGRDWLEAGIQADIVTLDLSTALLAYDDPTLAALEGIFKKWLNEAKTRGIILSYVLTMPKVEDFTAAVKATHEMTLLNVFTAVPNTEVHTFDITGTISVGG